MRANRDIAFELEGKGMYLKIRQSVFQENDDEMVQV
jgi:hypothetical protein